MMCHEFEQAVDSLLQEESTTTSVALTAEQRGHASQCATCAKLSRDLFWLHGRIRQLPLPTPSEGFSQRVVAEVVGTPVCTSQSATGRNQRGFFKVRWVLYAGTLAASVVCALLVIPDRTGPQSKVSEPFVQSNVPESVELTPLDFPVQLASSSGVRDLVRNVTDTLLEDPASESSQNASPSNGETPEIVTDFADLRMRRVFKTSTDNLLTSSKELTTSVEPITKAAVGAFDFLWQEFQPEEKPRT